jgi:hypothetical protein
MLLFAPQATAQGSRITGVDPPTAKVGDVVRVAGEGLSQGAVDELYLTNASQDVKVSIIEQGEKVITFKIPVDIKPGRWALMIHLRAATGTQFFEQPVKIKVE